MHDCLDRVVVGDRRVVLARERDLDQGEIVQTAIELRQLGLRVLARGLTRVVVTGGELELHGVLHLPPSYLSHPSYYRTARAKHTTSTRRAPARRSSVAHAVAVEPVV